MRGQIYDRNGTLLATSVTAKALWIIPQDVKITTSQLKEIAKTLDVPVSELRKKFNSKRTFVYLKRQVPIETAEKVLDMKFRACTHPRIPAQLPGRRSGCSDRRSDRFGRKRY